MPARIDGPRAGVPNSVKDNRPRIWCNHCDRQNSQVGDQYRHYRDSHPQFWASERVYWVFEIYANSRHGNTTASAVARIRTQQIINRMNGGPPVTAAPFGSAPAYTTHYATIASTLPSGARAVQTTLAGSLTLQTAPPAMGAQAAPPQILQAAQAPLQPNMPATSLHTNTHGQTAPSLAAALAPVQPVLSLIPPNITMRHEDDSSSSSGESDSDAESLPLVRAGLKRKRETEAEDSDTEEGANYEDDTRDVGGEGGDEDDDKTQVDEVEENQDGAAKEQKN